MAAVTSQPVEFDEQRAELKAVLESPQFVRAPKLAQLLSYLCEKLFSGQAGHIKEYSIGVEVFGRGDAFDQNTDSIVRVEANRLRKRLAEYYSSDGTSHRLRISIPVGQYVPEFEHVPPNGRVPTAQAGAVAGSEAALPVVSSVLSTSSATESGWVRNRGLGLWFVFTAFALIVGAGLVTLYYFRTVRQQNRTSPDVIRTEAPTSIADSPFGPPPGDEVRILSGASRSFVDHAGKLWSADTWVTGGSPVKVAGAQHIWRTLDPEFYRTFRQGEFRYDVPLKNGVYELRLHFAETTYGPESTGTGGEGSRIMTVRANGVTLLSGFDIAADAGASRTADVKIFANIEPAADGKLHLEFAGENGSQAELSAIEITPGVRGQLKPLRVLARQSPYYSNDSQWWSPDNYFEGGQIASYAAPVSGTDDPELYQTERWGNFSYAIPVTPGKYSVWLRFVARHSEGVSSPSYDKGEHAVHIFNVFCNGKMLLQNFDLPDEAKQSDIVLRKFSGLEPNAQGKLVLSFVPVEGYASVTGIEVLPQ